MDNMLHAIFHLSWPFLDYWIATTRSCGLITPILWWQSTRTEDARLAIVPIYRPTLTQMTAAPYPKIIDWVPHATLRDALIRSYSMYDLDTLICDLTEAYVMEDTATANDNFIDSSSSSSSSYNVMDMVLKTLGTSSAGGGYSGTFLPGPGLFDFPSNVSSTACTHSTPLSNSQLHQFKIDPSFFAKYPGLYHTSAVARRHVPRPVNVPKLQPPSPLDQMTMQAYLNLLLQNKV